MRLSRITVHNFRNFAHLDIPLYKHAVIVGENKIGKSNLLYAMRLVLDMSMPDSARHLRIEDFWDGLARPLANTEYIETSLEFADFEGSIPLLAILADSLISTSPLTARLSYRYQPKNSVSEPRSESDFEFLFYGGASTANELSYVTRRGIPLFLFDALRDAENDLERWRRSPLRPLIEAAAAVIPEPNLGVIAESVETASSALASQPEISAVATSVTERLTKMVGAGHAMDVSLRLAPTRADRLLRSLRLFIDGGARSMADASLGSANLLYLALRSLELELLQKEGSYEHFLLAIEEPEAHIHPHLQRLVYRDFLRQEPSDEAPGGSKSEESPSPDPTILLTTHSPHIVSVTPVRSLVVLKKSPDRLSTVGASTANLDLSTADVNDIERYLDATRGEIVYAKGVLLVEGMAEVILMPQLAKFVGIPLDELGITACSVEGTNFAPYLKLIGPSGPDVPFAVVTDLDPGVSPSRGGRARVRRLLASLLGKEQILAADGKDLDKLAEQTGLFLNSGTFESELWAFGHNAQMCAALIDIAETAAARQRAILWAAKPAQVDFPRMLRDIERSGKGRFAQRLSQRIEESGCCPDYLAAAVRHIVSRLE